MSGEAEGAPLTPESPVSHKIEPAMLEQYYESIKDPFDETQAGLEHKTPIGYFVLLFVLCLVPAIPYGLSRLVAWVSGHRKFSFTGIHVDASSFVFWWVVSFTVSLLLLILVGKFSGSSAQQKKRWLSPPQMRFAYCYGVVHEIKKYRTNHLPRHIDTALVFFNKTATWLDRGPADAPDGFYPDQIWRREIQLSPEQAALMNRVVGYPKWYRLRPETETILKAFGEFVPKLHDRLKDRKDLVSIEATLIELASYQYTEIPELSESKTDTQFEHGTELLLNFANKVIALPLYRSEPLNPTPKEEVSSKLTAIARNITGPFTDDNVLVAFLAWLVLTTALFCGGVYIALRYFSVRMDSTVMVAVVGGPITTAVAGATIPRLRKAEKRQE